MPRACSKKLRTQGCICGRPPRPDPTRLQLCSVAILERGMIFLLHERDREISGKDCNRSHLDNG